MIHTVYIISRNGLPIIAVGKDEKDDDFVEAALFSGILSAIQTAMQEIDVGVPKFVDTKKFEIFIELEEEFAVALVRESTETEERDLMHDITAEILDKLDKKYDDLSDYNLLSDKQLQDIRALIVNMIQKGEKELSKRKATKIASDSLW
ncbi:MAG: roadblock/LC7 domain-containing protein [Candidatus Heimdallarchaeota archaeon]|nr:roadblock/LC7 domain-containing protein [Candidatus Heimdallarchaeota archaeon]MCK4770173.1 roadblock/LC7 domain-containing protein [Candidatus Heimdallarchaeota archaeon]